MSDEQIALARRAMACDGWRWMPGMLCIWPNGNEFRVAQVNGIDGANDLPNYPAGGWGDDYPNRTTGIPDLTDPATLGCFLALVREAWGAPRAMVRLSADRKSFHIYDVPHGGHWAAWLSDDRCPSEAHALVDALEAAPQRGEHRR